MLLGSVLVFPLACGSGVSTGQGKVIAAARSFSLLAAADNLPDHVDEPQRTSYVEISYRL